VVVLPFEERVNRAIDAGVAWLRRIQREDGSFPYHFKGMGAPPPAGEKPMDQGGWAGGPWQKGADALAVYALAACDVPGSDAVLVKGFQRVREDWRSRRLPTSTSEAAMSADGVSTYCVSLTLMALDAACNRGVCPMGKGPPPKDKGKGPKESVAVPPEDLTWAAEMADWLRLAQVPGNDGGPGEPGPNAPHGEKRPKARTSGPPSLPVPTGDVPSPEDGGGFSYWSPCSPGIMPDNSNSQFAVLGLKAASRLGVRVANETWIRCLRHFLAAQETKGPAVPRVEARYATDGGLRKPGADPVTVGAPRENDEARGWAYDCPYFGITCGKRVLRQPPGGTAKPTRPMTAGGVSSLVICRSELDGVPAFTPALRRLTEKGIRDGLAWLSLHFEEDPGRDFPPDTPPERARQIQNLRGGPLDDFYYTYGLERACILGGVVRIGEHDWYREGAEVLLSRQKVDGSFLGKGGGNGNGTGIDLVDTSFALVFLKRALFRIPERRVATPVDEPPPGGGPPGPR